MGSEYVLRNEDENHTLNITLELKKDTMCFSKSDQNIAIPDIFSMEEDILLLQVDNYCSIMEVMLNPTDLVKVYNNRKQNEPLIFSKTVNETILADRVVSLRQMPVRYEMLRREARSKEFVMPVRNIECSE